ncbi:MAG: hypothetical protein ABEI39_05745 [Halobacteriales archaeon]
MSRLEDHYRAIEERYGYEPVAFDLGSLPGERARTLFAFGNRGEAVAEAPEASLVATGLGMTGPPHVGTLGQMLTAVRLQEAGFDVQFVLADLEVYNGRGWPLDPLRERAERYRSFLLDLGFDPGEGRLRTQFGAPEVMRTGHLLARYFDPEEDATPEGPPTAFEEALEAAYDDADIERGETTAFARETTGLLMLADFLHPLLDGDYGTVAVMLGADAHGWAVRANHLLDRAGHDARVAALYTRLIEGLAGHPKMSKSIPASRLDLAMEPAAIREAVTASEEYDRPADSRTYQMMCLASEYSAAELAARREACAEGGAAWADAKAEYADYLADMAAAWPGG